VKKTVKRSTKNVRRYVEILTYVRKSLRRHVQDKSESFFFNLDAAWLNEGRCPGVALLSQKLRIKSQFH